MSFTAECLGFAPDYVDYLSAWELQQRYHADVVAGRRDSTLLFLEHSPVFTAGKRTEDHERPVDGTRVIDVDRGGKITWHGPGQLVVYLIYRLNDPKEVRLFVDQIEDALIAVAADQGVETMKVEGRSGVWLPATETAPERKIGAIGIRIHEGVTMHGLALNCSNDNSGFDTIVPCGIADAGVTSLSAETGRRLTPADLAPAVEAALEQRIRA